MRARTTGILTAALLCAALSSCGPSIDPRLCDTCKRLEEIKNDKAATASLERENLERKRDERLRAYGAVDRLMGKPVPLHVECPECDKLYERLLMIRSSRGSD
jgi:hypothetical protein